jgi:hypothetical protein
MLNGGQDNKELFERELRLLGVPIPNFLNVRPLNDAKSVRPNSRRLFPKRGQTLSFRCFTKINI